MLKDLYSKLSNMKSYEMLFIGLSMLFLTLAYMSKSIIIPLMIFGSVIGIILTFIGAISLDLD